VTQESAEGVVRQAQSVGSTGTLARNGEKQLGVARPGTADAEGPNGPRKGLKGEASRTPDSWTNRGRKSRKSWPSLL
jgi:hypothetical protein